MQHSLPITCLGDASPGGLYILRIRVHQGTSVVFGRFKGKKALELPIGEYLYVGSAMKRLAPRLIRHATRSETAEPHAIRDDLIRYFDSTVGEARGLTVPRSKKLHWNVDHLLENGNVSLTHVFIIRSSHSLEASLGRLLEQEPCTFILKKGLGANDIPGNTHLLGVAADEKWWQALPEKLSRWYESAVAAQVKGMARHPDHP
jgi:Uri superfamily endonuclease